MPDWLLKKSNSHESGKTKTFQYLKVYKFSLSSVDLWNKPIKPFFVNVHHIIISYRLPFSITVQLPEYEETGLLLACRKQHSNQLMTALIQTSILLGSIDKSCQKSVESFTWSNVIQG